jgi:hypothetical protein
MIWILPVLIWAVAFLCWKLRRMDKSIGRISKALISTQCELRNLENNVFRNREKCKGHKEVILTIE